MTFKCILFQDKMALHLYSVNGKHLHSENVHSHITHMIVAEGFLITGNQHGVLGIKQLAGYEHEKIILWIDKKSVPRLS